ncbi:hypothetical protein E2C01_016809 [Portunus trituberculatus]|uniref:Uncharacterized protein n=1 Tax=Portunus trituberculatus TaxID=210409 RepID=A0A5B7DQS6_PORTR|nr:hypothetical protein [Portunus trituberculatus]
MVYRSGQSSPPFTAACLPFPTPAAPRQHHSTGEARTGCMLILVEVLFQTHSKTRHLVDNGHLLAEEDEEEKKNIKKKKKKKKKKKRKE